MGPAFLKSSLLASIRNIPVGWPEVSSGIFKWHHGREAAGAALDAGTLLTAAKGRLRHGEWGDWIGRVGLAPRTASTWMKLAGMDLTAEDVIDRGGINAAARGGKPESASEADLPGSVGRELADAEAAIDTKRAYYDALNRRHRALSALARETNQ